MQYHNPETAVTVEFPQGFHITSAAKMGSDYSYQMILRNPHGIINATCGGIDAPTIITYAMTDFFSCTQDQFYYEWRGWFNKPEIIDALEEVLADIQKRSVNHPFTRQLGDLTSDEKCRVLFDAFMSGRLSE